MHADLTQCMAMKETPARVLVFHVGLMRLLKMQDTALRKEVVSLEIFASCV